MPETHPYTDALSNIDRQTHQEVSPNNDGKVELFKLKSPVAGEPDLITVELLNAYHSEALLKIVADNKQVKIPQRAVKFTNSVFSAQELTVDDTETRHLLKTNQTAVFIPRAKIGSSDRLLLQLQVEGKPFFIDIHLEVPSFYSDEPYIYTVEGNVQLFKERVLSIDQFLNDHNVDTSDLAQLELALLDWAYKRQKKEAAAAPQPDSTEAQLVDSSQNHLSTSQELQLFFWAKAVYLSVEPNTLPNSDDEQDRSTQASPLKDFIQNQLSALFPVEEINELEKNLEKRKQIIATSRNAFAGIEQRTTSQPALSPQEQAKTKAELAKLIKKVEHTFFFLQQAVDTRMVRSELFPTFLTADEVMNNLLTGKDTFKDTFFADLLALCSLSPHELVDTLFELYQDKNLYPVKKLLTSTDQPTLNEIKNMFAKLNKRYFKRRFATEITALLEVQAAFNEYKQEHQAKRKNEQADDEKRLSRLADSSTETTEQARVPRLAELLGKSNDTSNS